MISISPLGYIDPGSGSMLLQIIISAILGTAIFFRRMVARVFLWIKSKLFRSQSRESKN